jgi:putative transposase
MADLVSHSSSIGSCWVHLAFKVKYCHRIFDVPDIKTRADQLLREAMDKHHIRCRELGIDSDHVHIVLDLGLRSVSHVVKLLKGYTGKKLMKEHPWVKREYFWGSGMWNPSYFFDSLGQDLEELSRYVREQGMPRDQTRMERFLTN